MELTFEQLPSAVSRLYSKLEDIERLLQLKTESSQQCDIWFDLEQLCVYDPSKREKQTFYGLVSRNEIPHYKKGKKLFFLKSEIDAWLKTGKQKTVSEIEVEADAYLHSQKKKSQKY